MSTITLTKHRAGNRGTMFLVGDHTDRLPGSTVAAYVLPDEFGFNPETGSIHRVIGYTAAGLPLQIIELESGWPAIGSQRDGFIEIYPVIAPDCKSIREAAGMTQGEFAPLIGSTQQHMSKWEKSKIKPTAATQVLLALIARRPDLLADLREIAESDHAKNEPPIPV